MKNPIALLLLLIGRFYQLFISPLKPPTCRFYPTCSEYFIQAVRLLGPVRGTIKTVRRVARCHPFCEGGFDPVIPEGKAPPKKKRAPRERDAS